MATVAELTTPMTIAECRAAIYAYLEAAGVVTSAWKPGGVARTIIHAVAMLASAYSSLQALFAESAFLSTAEGDWLTLTARHVFGVERSLGTLAASEVTLVNAGVGVYSGDPGDLVFVAPANGKSYRNSEPYTISGAGTYVIPVVAIELGSASSVAEDGISELVTPLSGVTVDASTAAVGADEESDEALRTRCRATLGALSPNGPKDAYDAVARAATRADGSEVGVTRVAAVADGEGHVDVYVASASGAVPGDSEDEGTDLGAVALAIRSQVEPLAVEARIYSAAELSIAVTYEAWVPASSLSDEQLEDAVELALAAWLARVPIGGQVLPGEPGRVYVSAIQATLSAALADATGEPAIRVEVTVPAADVSVSSSQAPALGTVTPTTHQVST